MRAALFQTLLFSRSICELKKTPTGWAGAMGFLNETQGKIPWGASKAMASTPLVQMTVSDIVERPMVAPVSFGFRGLKMQATELGFFWKFEVGFVERSYVGISLLLGRETNKNATR